MKKWLLRNLQVIDPASEFNGRRVDLRLHGETIAAIGEGLKADGETEEDLSGVAVSPGWVDIGAWVGDPGQEHREDLESLARAASAGGYTQVAVLPNTEPALDSKSGITYIRRQASGQAVTLLPLGAVSLGAEGRELTEMMDMQQAGALAFTDGLRPIQHAGLMQRALLYARSFDGIILNRPHEQTVAGGGQVHEGPVSTRLGLRGIPTLAETLMLERDLHLLQYCESRLHVHNLSAAESVERLRAARAAGLRVTAGVPALNLLFEHSVMEEFDSHFKVLPPLRAATDRDALRAGLLDGTIDLITSNHLPREIETKALEFANASFGALGLQTAFAVARTALREVMDIGQLVTHFSHRPRKIFGLPERSIAEGQTAELTFFEPDRQWKLQRSDIRSRSHNSPLIDTPLTGRPVATYHNGLFWR